jgi:hypothetical protein
MKLEPRGRVFNRDSVLKDTVSTICGRRITCMDGEGTPNSAQCQINKIHPVYRLYTVYRSYNICTSPVVKLLGYQYTTANKVIYAS